MTRKLSPRLGLATLLAAASAAAFIATAAPQPASAHGVHRYYRWHHAAYGGPWIRAGFFYASAPGFYPGVGWVGYAPPPAYGLPSYAAPAYYPAPAYYAPAPAYYAPAPVYYGPAPGYYAPAYGGPTISIGVWFGGGHGWRR